MSKLSTKGSHCVKLFLLLFIISIATVNAQQSVSIGTAIIKANAVLYLKGTGTQGLIIPAVSSNGSFGEAGMLVFNTTDNKLYYHNGAAWVDATNATEVDGVIGNEVTQVNIARGGLELTGAGTNASPLSIGLIQGTTDGQVLQWNNTTKQWQLKTISSTDSQDLSLAGTTLSLTNDLTPVTLGNLAILNTVASAQITDASVAAADMAPGSVSGGASGTIADGTITNADISATAAMAVSKLAPGTNGQVLTVSAGAASWQTPSASVTKLDDLSDVAVAAPASGQVLVNDGAGNFKNVSVSGDINISNTGTATIQPGAISGGAAGDIADGTITNADISGTAAIAGTKISPDFGAQNIITSGKTVFNSVGNTWPNAQGAANTFLQNDGAGNLSWTPSPSPYSTNNQVPKGNGTGLTDSQISDDGTNVGIGTTTPSHRLTLFNPSSYSLLNFQTTTTDITSGDGFMIGLDNPSGDADIWNWEPGRFIKFGTAGSERMRIDGSGNVGIGTSSPTTTLEVNGFTKLGTDAPAIKVLKLTGTTSNSQGGSVSISTGLAASQILSVSVMVEYFTGNFIGQGYTNNTGYQFNWYGGATITVWNTSGNSANILSKPIKILVTYEP